MFENTTPACTLALLTNAKAAIAKILNSFTEKAPPKKLFGQQTRLWDIPKPVTGHFGMYHQGCRTYKFVMTWSRTPGEKKEWLKVPE
jgi:hypothetical protein